MEGGRGRGRQGGGAPTEPFTLLREMKLVHTDRRLQTKMVTPDGVFSEACGLPNSDIPGHDKPSLCKVRIISTSLAHVDVCMSPIHGKAVSLHTYPPSNVWNVDDIQGLLQICVPPYKPLRSTYVQFFTHP